MSDFPQNRSATQTLLPRFVHTFGPQSHIGEYGRSIASAVSPGACTWSANYGAFMPMSLPWDYPVKRIFWANGANSGTYSFSFGIYHMADDTMRAVYTTGAVTRTGADQLQFVTPSAPFILPAGEYYFGFACNTGGTTCCFGFSHTPANLPYARIMGLKLSAATAHPLGDTITVTNATATNFQLCGITNADTWY